MFHLGWKCTAVVVVVVINVHLVWGDWFALSMMLFQYRCEGTGLIFVVVVDNNIMRIIIIVGLLLSVVVVVINGPWFWGDRFALTMGCV